MKNKNCLQKTNKRKTRLVCKQQKKTKKAKLFLRTTISA